VSLENVLPAVLKTIAADSAFTALVGSDIGEISAGVPWLFQDTYDDNRPFRDPKGTGKAAVVVGFRDSWGVNGHNTMGMPMVQVLVYADLSRNADGTPQARDAKNRATRVWETIDAILHDVRGSLSGVKVVLSEPVGADFTFVSSRRREGPSIMPVPDGDGMERLMARYEVAAV
jgi:hypothetical protein